MIDPQSYRARDRQKLGYSKANPNVIAYLGTGPSPDTFRTGSAKQLTIGSLRDTRSHTGA
ncbi:MAG: hypothetical protein WCA22_18670 [Candidatus Binatus sp.]